MVLALQFFLRGTQLSQLADEYNICHDNIKATFKTLAQKKGALPDLRTAFRDATLRFEEAAMAREQKKKIDELKKELAWAHVKAKEEEMAAKIEDAAKLARRLPKIQKNVDGAVVGHSLLIPSDASYLTSMGWKDGGQR